jgi:predicted nuclease of predicted toxin-antitoxin system
LRFLLDENIAVALGHVLAAAGHDYDLVEIEIAKSAPDDVIALHSVMLGAVLVSHDRDFQSIGPRVPFGRQRFARLSRIWLRCVEERSPSRMAAALPFIEFEWALAQTRRDTRMILEIGDSYLRTNR